VSKARGVQSLREDFAAFTAVFIVVFAPIFPAILVFADISAAATSAFVFAK
jgi:hypothetical protein